MLSYNKDGKFIKATVRYRHAEMGNRSCLNCASYDPKEGSCIDVEGNINPEAQCDIHLTLNEIAGRPIKLMHDYPEVLEQTHPIVKRQSSKRIKKAQWDQFLKALDMTDKSLTVVDGLRPGSIHGKTIYDNIILKYLTGTMFPKDAQCNELLEALNDYDIWINDQTLQGLTCRKDNFVLSLRKSRRLFKV